jgi:WD40 repeat protein
MALGLDRRVLGGVAVGAIALSPDGRTVAGGCAEGVVKLWDSAPGEERQTLFRHTGSVSMATFSKDGRWLATAGPDNIIRPWRWQE